MNGKELEESVSRLTDDALAGLIHVMQDEVKARRAALHAALPEDVWMVALEGHRSQVTRQRALELTEAGTHELVSAPQGDEPTDLCVVATKQGAVIQVTRDKAIELLEAGSHRLATLEEYGAAA